MHDNERESSDTKWTGTEQLDDPDDHSGEPSDDPIKEFLYEKAEQEEIYATANT